MYKHKTRSRSIQVVLRSCIGTALCVCVPLSLNANAEIFGDEDLKDPTRPVGASLVINEGQEDGIFSGLLGSAGSLLRSGYEVSFIRAGGAEPVAMINQVLVKTGDMIGEAEVVAIEADSVSLKVDGEIQRVASFSNTIKSRAQTP